MPVSEMRKQTGRQVAAADAAAELVELSQAEALRAFDGP